MKNFIALLLVIAALSPTVSVAQDATQQATVTGIVTNDENTFLSGATVTVQGTSFSAQTDENGGFKFENVPFGTYILVINAPDHRELVKEIKIEKAATDLGYVTVERMLAPDADGRDEPPVFTGGDDEIRAGASQGVSGSLTAGRDGFSTAMSFVFTAARFDFRGYDDANFETYMNGAPMTDLENGRSTFYLWGGLNNVTSNRDNAVGLSPSTFAFGGIGGATAIDSRASKQRKQIQASYAATDRTYNNRVMVTWGSGLMKGGWAMSASYSRRWADEAYVKGTYYDAVSGFFSVEKLFGTQHSLALTVFAAPAERGKSGPAINEIYDLAGDHYYNPNWGYQNGEIRNSRVGKSFLPTGILSYTNKYSEKSEFKASLGYVTGKSENTALDWFNAPDPRPDYYRKLPSFIDDPLTAAAVDAALRDNESLRQIQWDEMYLANFNSYETINNVDGIAGNSVSGKRSRYIVENRIKDYATLSGSALFNSALSDISDFSAGVTYQHQEVNNYKEVDDLLGGDFYVDWNQYAEQDFPDNPDAVQNDLNNPNRILHEGDKYGYDYVSDITKYQAWIQNQFKLDFLDAFIGLQLSNTAFLRTGNVKNGLFPDNSYGDSDEKTFTNYGVKGGLTFKLDGRNFIFTNLSYSTRAPYFDNAFVSVRTRNEYVKDLTDEKVFSVEGGYLLKAPKIKARAVAYLTEFSDGADVVSFYHSDYRTFVNYALTGIDKRHVGTELALDLALGKGFNAYAVAAIGQYYYQSRPKATATADNTSDVLSEDQTVYFNEMHTGGTPESAYTLGLGYRAKKFWFVTFNLNYFDKNYVQMNPARRTQSAVDLVPVGSDQWNSILEQEELKGQMTADLFFGKSWKLNEKKEDAKHNTYFLINVGVSNIFDNQDLITGGFEQLRYDYTDKDPNTFPSKYFYGFGRTYFINLILRMN